MIEERLIEYGAIGVFCAYLIFDKQVLMGRLLKALDRIAVRIEQCPKVTKPQYL